VSTLRAIVTLLLAVPVEPVAFATTGGPTALETPGRPTAWTTLRPGLEVGRFVAPIRAAVGDSMVTVVRVDPAQYEFRLLSAKLLGLSAPPTAPEWAARPGVLGVVNASMFQVDHETSTGYMQDGSKLNNRAWNKDNAVFAAGPLVPGLPAARIFDRTCDDWQPLAKQYAVLVQNIRMLDCAGKNTWAPSSRKWSTACVGADADGRMLLVHVRSAYATHDLIDVLLALPLGLKRLMYVEGGPEASLYVKLGDEPQVSEIGSFETGFFEADENRRFWPLPNVLAIVAR
jgi:hypothetical protein